eukprot:XP_001700416.1 predicted protein [Chlamydomonas reinhardtii]
MAFWAGEGTGASCGLVDYVDWEASRGDGKISSGMIMDAVLTLNYQAWSAAYSGHLEALRYLAEAVGGEATEGDEEGQAGDRGGRGGGASAGGAGAGAAGSRVASGSEWASVLRAAGYYGADLSLARLMYARCGRDTDILFAAATAGGSVETAEWAMEAQRAANKDCRHPLLHPAELWVMAAGGNLATTTWALELGLVGPLELEGPTSRGVMVAAAADKWSTHVRPADVLEPRTWPPFRSAMIPVQRHRQPHLQHIAALQP